MSLEDRFTCILDTPHLHLLTSYTTTIYHLHCILYIIQCTMYYAVHCIVYSVQRTLPQYKSPGVNYVTNESGIELWVTNLYVHRTMYTVYCTVDSVVYSVHRTVYSVHGMVHVHCWLQQSLVADNISIFRTKLSMYNRFYSLSTITI